MDSVTMDGTAGPYRTWSSSTVAQTVAYPACQRSVAQDGNPHDFQAHKMPGGGQPLLYCRQCGQVRKLEITED